MSTIFILPEHLANKIAAGEIVERPSSVVKELVENSVDARSTRIRVEIKNAGKGEIKVIDNGAGMSRDDALLAFERHATSKIKILEDLEAVSTLGFRGEALPSIASVSRVKLVTKSKDEEAGTQITIDGGVLKDVREIGAPSGTTIIVRNLFYNTPARRKFLRTNQTEMNHISEQFLRLALGHPSIHFSLSHQRKIVYDFPSVKDFFTRAAQVFGAKLIKGGQDFLYEKHGMILSGFVGPPEMNRSTMHSIYVFVNHRYIRDTLLNRTITKAYEGLLPKNRFPVALVMVNIAPEAVDVNVHPTKSEVRFRELPLVLEAVKNAVSDALHRLQKKAWDRPLITPKEVPSVGSLKEPPENYPLTEHSSWAMSVQPEEFAPKKQPTHEPLLLRSIFPEENRGLFSSLRIIGQLGNSYILCEAPDGLVIIDQHAAHERIIFDQLMESSQNIPKSVQLLLTPQPLELLPHEVSLLRELLPLLRDTGFDIEPFGGSTFLIKSIPSFLDGEDPAHLVADIISEAISSGWVKERVRLSVKLKQSMACRAAVKANACMLPEEIKELLEKLDITGNPSTCPHGRPLWWKITHDEIARFFKRGHSPIQV